MGTGQMELGLKELSGLSWSHHYSLLHVLVRSNSPLRLKERDQPAGILAVKPATASPTWKDQVRSTRPTSLEVGSVKRLTSRVPLLSPSAQGCWLSGRCLYFSFSLEAAD